MQQQLRFEGQLYGKTWERILPGATSTGEHAVLYKAWGYGKIFLSPLLGLYERVLFQWLYSFIAQGWAFWCTRLPACYFDDCSQLVIGCVSFNVKTQVMIQVGQKSVFYSHSFHCFKSLLMLGIQLTIPVSSVMTIFWWVRVMLTLWMCVAYTRFSLDVADSSKMEQRTIIWSMWIAKAISPIITLVPFKGTSVISTRMCTVLFLWGASWPGWLLWLAFIERPGLKACCCCFFLALWKFSMIVICLAKF